MEKVIYTLYEADVEKLVAGLAAKLPDTVSKLRFNVRDSNVAAGNGLIQSRGDKLANAVVQLWMPSSNSIFRKEVDAAIAAFCGYFHAWMVVESTIIANEKYAPKAGNRTDGFSQIALLTLPERLDWRQWRSIWRDYHTQIAIDTQSNFEYVQNLVVEPLTEGAPPYVAIVEECFPLAALTDPYIFFDAVGDQEKFDQNLGIMMGSVGRFIDQGTIDVFPTSQFDITN
jgi:hypothetical protein